MVEVGSAQSIGVRFIVTDRLGFKLRCVSVQVLPFLEAAERVILSS